MSKSDYEMTAEQKRRALEDGLEWGSPKHWRAWGSWFSWGSPVGLGLFLLALAGAVWILSQIS